MADKMKMYVKKQKVAHPHTFSLLANLSFLLKEKIGKKKPHKKTKQTKNSHQHKKDDGYPNQLNILCSYGIVITY